VEQYSYLYADGVIIRIAAQAASVPPGTIRRRCNGLGFDTPLRRIYPFSIQAVNAISCDCNRLKQTEVLLDTQHVFDRSLARLHSDDQTHMSPAS